MSILKTIKSDGSHTESKISIAVVEAKYKRYCYAKARGKLTCHYRIEDTEQLEKIVNTLYCCLILSFFFFKAKQVSSDVCNRQY